MSNLSLHAAYTKAYAENLSVNRAWYTHKLGATRRGLGTGETAKQTSKLPNELPNKSSSQTLSRQK